MTDLLRVENLVTRLRSDGGEFAAVDGISLRVGPGEAVALVGESGCGKSMTALSLMRLTPTVARLDPGSEIHFDGRNLATCSERQMQALRGSRIAMIFQDPMTFLNPVIRIGDQIAEGIRLHRKLNRRAAAEVALQALQRVRIPAPEAVLGYFPHQLSGGMRQRVLIAMAIACEPDLLIADEPTTALDVTIQAQIMLLLGTLRRELGSAMLLITHDLGLVAEHCDRVYVMYAGQIVEEGSVFDIFEAPQHPYTRALLQSSLSIDHRVESFQTIEGQPPSLARPPSGCRFHPRCPVAIAACRRERPTLVKAGDGVRARCLLVGADAGAQRGQA